MTMNAEFLRFVGAGGLAAAVNLASRYGLSYLMPFEAAVALAYLLGMATAYLLTRVFVFPASGRTAASEIRRFILVNVAALVLVWIISVGLARLLFPAIGFTWHADDVAHVIGVLSPAITSYFGHRLYTFARRPT